MSFHQEGFRILEPRNPFSILANRLRKIGIEGPQGWWDEHGDIPTRLPEMA